MSAKTEAEISDYHRLVRQTVEPAVNAVIEKRTCALDLDGFDVIVILASPSRNGLSRDTFYRYEAAIAEFVFEAQLETGRRRPKHRKHRTHDRVR